MLKVNFEAGLFTFSISENTSEQTLRATDIVLVPVIHEHTARTIHSAST